MQFRAQTHIFSWLLAAVFISVANDSARGQIKYVDRPVFKWFLKCFRDAPEEGFLLLGPLQFQQFKVRGKGSALLLTSGCQVPLCLSPVG